MAEVKDQPDLKPTRKATAATAGSAAAVLIVFLAGQFGVEISAEAGAAIATLLTFVGAYFKREAK